MRTLHLSPILGNSLFFVTRLYMVWQKENEAINGAPHAEMEIKIIT